MKPEKSILMNISGCDDWFLLSYIKYEPKPQPLPISHFFPRRSMRAILSAESLTEDGKFVAQIYLTHFYRWQHSRVSQYGFWFVTPRSQRRLTRTLTIKDHNSGLVFEAACLVRDVGESSLALDIEGLHSVGQIEEETKSCTL